MDTHFYIFTKATDHLIAIWAITGLPFCLSPTSVVFSVESGRILISSDLELTPSFHSNMQQS